MTKQETQKKVKLIKSKLEKVIDMHMTACGHELPLRLAFEAEQELVALIKSELEKRDNDSPLTGKAFGRG